ncbi:MAG: hypothetical protein R3B09_23840 [Nannocystaceae bacterium]
MYRNFQLIAYCTPTDDAFPAGTPPTISDVDNELLMGQVGGLRSRRMT